MSVASESRARLLDAAAQAVASRGLAGLTVAAVASVAGTSSALVHYHFDTKRALIVALAERMAKQRVESLATAARRGRGLATLDLLWDTLVERSASGSERAMAELIAASASDAGIAAALRDSSRIWLDALAQRGPALMRELGSWPPTGAEEFAAAVAAQLDGVAAALLAGRPAAEVRTAYDAFWLILIAAGQGARRR